MRRQSVLDYSAGSSGVKHGNLKNSTGEGCITTRNARQSIYAAVLDTVIGYEIPRRFLVSKETNRLSGSSSSFQQRNITINTVKRSLRSNPMQRKESPPLILA